MLHPSQPFRATSFISLGLLASLASSQVARAEARAHTLSPYLYRWSFDASGLPESEFRDGVRGGELTVGGGETDSVPIFRQQGGVGTTTPGVLDTSRNRYGSPNGAQVNSFGSPLRTSHTLARFTITMWVKPALPADQQPQARLLNLSPETDEQASQSVLLSLDSDGFGFRVNGSLPAKYEASEPVIKPDEWVFLVFAYDGTAENPYYSPGMIEALSNPANAAILAGSVERPARLVSKVAVNTGPPTYTVSPGSVTLDKLMIAIGSSNSRFDRAFVGLIDDVRIYNAVLSMSELERVRLEALGK